MATKHMPPTRQELLEDTAILFILTLMYMTKDPLSSGLSSPLCYAARSNDRRWMAGHQSWHPDADLVSLRPREADRG